MAYYHLGQLSVLGLVFMVSLAHAKPATEVHVGQQGKSSTAQSLAKCPEHFHAGKAPTLTGDKGNKLARDSYELCFHGFGVLYSGVSRTPIYSASHLTKARVNQARSLTRQDNFHEESRLPKKARATLNDYRGSGYDRGHLAPNGDMENVSQQFDSFSLANIAPQSGEHNRGVWQGIEKDVRNLTIKYGELYVVTGVAFNGKKIASIGDGVLVPSHFFKAVYVPSINKAGVYYSPNTPSGQIEHISLSELTNRTGINAMPSLSSKVQNQAFNLPEVAHQPSDPKPASKDKDTQTSEQSGWAVIIQAIIMLIASLFK